MYIEATINLDDTTLLLDINNNYILLTAGRDAGRAYIASHIRGVASNDECRRIDNSRSPNYVNNNPAADVK